jgi:organic hydroperoxide reductase OsmC/OhrA
MFSGRWHDGEIMKDYPHIYRVYGSGGTQGSVEIGADGLPPIATFPPPEFDGPEGHWSPETLLMAAVADCFVLSFRTVAHASRFEWERLEVDVHGVLDRVDGVTRFTRFTVVPRLSLPAEGDARRGRALLDKAKRVCLISNSLIAECELALPDESPMPAAAAA